MLAAVFVPCRLALHVDMFSPTATTYFKRLLSLTSVFHAQIAPCLQQACYCSSRLPQPGMDRLEDSAAP